MILQFENVTKQFPQKTLFSDVNFTINKNERVGLIGLNGSGKTTLIKHVMREELPDKGKVIKPSGLSLGCLYQEMYENDKRTLYEAMLDAFEDLLKIKKRLKSLESGMGKDSAAEKKYGDLQHEFEHRGGYDIDLNIEKVLAGLSFTRKDFDRKISGFSGGEKRRAGLAYLLLKKPDFLILDEPTNHLDLLSVKWLENFLVLWEGAILIISHDRIFLDKTVNRIFEIDNKEITAYTGNYEDFLKQKAMNLEVQKKEYEKQQKKIKETEEFIRRNIAGQKTKQAQSRRKMLKKMERVTPIHEEERKILIERWNVGKSFNHVLECKNLEKEYAGDKILNGVDLDLYRGERVALVGANGTGKTTLLKIVSGVDQEFAGECTIGERVNAFYFSQDLGKISGDDSVFDFIHSKIPMSTNNEVMNLLAWFYFRGDEVNNRVDNLSGGEKSRLLTLSVLLSEANFLLLDEPTNHLDLYTRESLAEALCSYPGSILFVSHDRYFIDAVATKVYVLSNGKLNEIMGGFSDNEEQIMSLFSGDKNNAAGESSKNGFEEKLPENKTKVKKNINVYKVNKIEEEISVLENKKSLLEKEKYKEDNYKDGRKMKEIENEINKIDNLIIVKMNEWESYQN